MSINIAFATEVTYPNYCNRIKQSVLKYFFDYNLKDYNISYYISTNRLDLFKDLKEYSFIKVYDVDTLRDNEILRTYEILPENPIGLYPSKYPWNLRRYIIKKAAEDGYNYIIYLDADNVFHPMDSQEFYQQLLNNFENNIVSTNQTIFRYSNRTPDDVFNYHDSYIKHFNLSFRDEQYDTIDGPVQVFMGQSSDLINFTNIWTKMTEFGYTKPLGVGYGNNKHGNLSFVIPMSNFKLKWKSFPFYPNHIMTDRY